MPDYGLRPDQTTRLADKQTDNVLDEEKSAVRRCCMPISRLRLKRTAYLSMMTNGVGGAA